MAYFLHHTCNFQNREVENMVIELYKKNVEPDSITDIIATQFRVTYGSGKGNKLDDIITCEAILGIWLPPSSPLTYQDFIIIFQDEWLIKAYDDSQIVFQGYLVPSEGESDFQDKPYELTLSATDGLALLKDEPITTHALAEFTSTHRLIVLLYHVLNKTGLSLPIDVRANIYEESMISRDTNADMDFTAQTTLHYKSLLKSSTEFMSCWDFLVMFCKQHFSLYQWNGHWVFNRFAEMQDSIGPTNTYTVWDVIDDVLTPSGIPTTQTYAQIGRQLKLHPVNANQRIASRFPIKSAKHTFNYEVWHDIPTNNKFDRGDFLAPYGGPGYTAWRIDNWTYGTFNSLASMTINPTTSQAFRKSSFDGFGIETLREVVLTNLGGGQKFLLAEPIPVKAGDKVRIGVDFLDTDGDLSVPIGQDRAIFYAFLSPDGVTKSHTLIETGKWKTGINFVAGRYEADENEREFHNFSVESTPIPFDGFLFVGFHHNKSVTTAEFHYSNFSFEYLPFVANGNNQVDGDYWITSQDTNYKDVIDEEVGLSDCIIKVVRGALFRLDGITLTTPTWHRVGHTEMRHYKELLNYGVYNHLYRSQWRISGTFGGTKFAPVSDPTLMEPLSFHKHFAFPDAPELTGVYFMLVPPLTIDYHKGRVDGTFVDCINAGGFDVGVPTANDVMNSLIAAINNMTIAQWQASAGAPPEGTLYFPPEAKEFAGTPNTIRIETTFDSSPYAAADDNGIGNSPTITETGNYNFLTRKVMYYTIGSDVQVGNRFVISLYGVQVLYTVGGSMIYHDGNQMGDGHYFNYKFK